MVTLFSLILFISALSDAEAATRADVGVSLVRSWPSESITSWGRGVQGGEAGRSRGAYSVQLRTVWDRSKITCWTPIVDSSI